MKRKASTYHGGNNKTTFWVSYVSLMVIVLIMYVFFNMILGFLSSMTVRNQAQEVLQSSNHVARERVSSKNYKYLQQNKRSDWSFTLKLKADSYRLSDADYAKIKEWVAKHPNRKYIVLVYVAKNQNFSTGSLLRKQYLLYSQLLGYMLHTLKIPSSNIVYQDSLPSPYSYDMIKMASEPL
ncbi:MULTISPECIES: hypothetical protein [Cysteiniphilum]|uniref:Uncharacterized protein n=1 Tax=Cysteiniphilum litorale TaxID=2056700 RepID=A0A8J2Z4H5_9GAMM|nr:MULTISPECIES: hypothetical protein [Cysteiniphilum]GGF96486.1 hypothetical protein GCM10010995_12160 [Cysteiniphilum litorale]